MTTPATTEALAASSLAAPRAWSADGRRRMAALGESVPATVGLAIVLAWATLALLAPLIAPYPPNASDLAALAHAAPSTTHWLGTDHVGGTCSRASCGAPAPCWSSRR